MPRILLLLLLFFAFTAHAADPRPKGKFKYPSVKLGEPVVYSLSLRHDSTLEVLFPDSSYNFSPFELLGYQHFPTKTTAAGSFDSIVYTLATFELAPTQGLAVPVFISDPKAESGKRAIYPMADSVYLEEVIKTMPDSVRLNEDASMVYVPKAFNIQLLLLILLPTLGVIAIAGFLLQNQIATWWNIRQAHKRYEAFKLDFMRLTGKAPIDIAHVQLLWKQYIGQIIKYPLASFTTKEISQVIDNQNIISSLKKLDRGLYANDMTAETTSEACNSLLEFATDTYQAHLEHLKQQAKARKRKRPNGTKPKAAVTGKN